MQGHLLQIPTKITFLKVNFHLNLYREVSQYLIRRKNYENKYLLRKDVLN